MDIHSVLAGHKSREKSEDKILPDRFPRKDGLITVEIPEIFFDDILMSHKLGRIDILVLMLLYRKIWCKPNLYRIYGISPMLSLNKMGSELQTAIEGIHTSLRNLESYGLTLTIRSGQYFVRRYFTKEWDQYFSQTYDNFEG